MIKDSYIEWLKQTNFCNGEPVKYDLKVGGTVQIKPILVRDVNNYLWAKEVVDIDKGSINDAKILSSKYLRFIYDYLIPSNHLYAGKLYMLLKLCLDRKVYFVDDDYNGLIKDNRAVIALVDDNSVVTGFISESEFDDIVKIIKYQNDASYIDRYLSPDVKKAVEEYYSLQSKKSNAVEPSLEKKKAFVTSKTGILLSQLNDLTYRYFVEIYNSCLSSELYIGQKIIQGSYKYEVKQDIVHPMFEKEKDPILEAFGGDAEEFERKINGINGK